MVLDRILVVMVRIVLHWCVRFLVVHWRHDGTNTIHRFIQYLSREQLARLRLRALSREQLELLDSALSEKDSGVPSTAKYFKRTRDEKKQWSSNYGCEESVALGRRSAKVVS